MFAKGTLKSQHVPRSKKGTLVKPPDLKGSKFKCLRGISDDDVLRLLQELSEEKMISECTSLKQLQKVQLAFLKGTNCSSWEEAVVKYQKFTTAEQLEPFKKLKFQASYQNNF